MNAIGKAPLALLSKGWRVDAASLLLKDSEPRTDDEAMIQKLREEGAIFVFQTTVPEQYISPMTWSRLYGVTRNPWNLYYGTGGSSGGSGAALAAGFCTLATGSDSLCHERAVRFQATVRSRCHIG